MIGGVTGNVVGGVAGAGLLGMLDGPLPFMDAVGGAVGGAIGGDIGKAIGGKGKKQSGFLFWENKDGWNFKSMDGLCEQDSVAKYTYAQANVGNNNPGTNFYQIESVIYPERANQLDKLRQGAYKQCTYGIVMAQLTDSYMPNAGATSSTTFDEWVKLNVPYTANDGSAGSLNNEQLLTLYNASKDIDITFNKRHIT